MYRKYEINVRGLQNQYSSHDPLPFRIGLSLTHMHLHSYTVTYAPRLPPLHLQSADKNMLE